MMLCDFPQELVLKHEQLENLTPTLSILYAQSKVLLLFFSSVVWVFCRHFKHVTTFYLIIGQIFIENFLHVRNCTKPQGYKDEEIWYQYSIMSIVSIISNMPIICHFSECYLTCPKSFLTMLIIQCDGLNFFQNQLTTLHEYTLSSRR